jgi:hypothetical protein
MWSSLLSVILVINELMASNAGEVLSPAINYDSWIELYNPTDQEVDLAGFYLSDDQSNLKKWEMPSDIGSVPAKGFKIIWLGSNDIKLGREENEVGEDQAPFKLDCDGGTIYLSDKSGQLIISQDYPEALSRTSWARKTDGGEEWGWTSTPTPEASNATAKFADKRLNAPVVSVDSKLFTGTLQFTVDIPEGATLMYTTDGSLPSAPVNPGEGVSPWKELVINGDCEGTQKGSLSARNAGDNKDSDAITDGVGVIVNGINSRGIKVHTSSTAKNDHDAQFFVYTPNHIWRTGDRYRFKMMVRADKASKMTTQTHTTPHNYITNGMFNGTNISVSTEWKEYSFEGTITDEQCGKSGGGWDWWGGQQPVTYKDMQTIAFNLNVDKKDNNFYFDNVSWEYDTTSGTPEDTSEESKDGKFTISKTTNYTFRLYQDGYLPSVPVTRSYIQTSNKYTLPVISIVGDKKYFTDPKIGFDCDGDGTNGKVTGYTNGQARNYAQDWDRPVNFSYIDTDGKMKFNQDVNISVSGGFTRTQQYRSFKLKSSKIFDGQNRLDYLFFPQKPYNRNKTLLLRNGGNDVWTNNARFTDPVLETIIQRSGIDVDVQSYVPIIEYVNGELRGVLNMREPNNDKFAYANWGYDDEELDAFENLTMKNGDDQAINCIFKLGKNCTDDEAYEELKTLLDIDEFTNYMAVTLFLFNDDWPDNNIKAYRSRNNGRYRFISYDLDYAFARCWNYSGNDPFANFVKFKDEKAPRTSFNKEIVNLFLNLLSRDDYRRKFIDTFSIMGGSVFESNRANAIVDELLNNVKAMCELMKKQGIRDGHEPDNAAKVIKDNLKGRPKKMSGYMKSFSYLNLGNTNAQAVTLNTDTKGAHIYVNGIDVPYASFDGYLFAPVELSVRAPAGYTFAGWKKSGEYYSEDEYLELPTDNTVKLTATFTPIGDELRQAFGITPVRINEVSAANGIYANEYWNRNDWVELYNTTDQPIDVEGMYLSNNPDPQELTKYKISKGESSASTVIPAHGYLIIWCDKLKPETQLHATFNLKADGGDVLLTAADESWTDRLTYSKMSSDQTAGRYPDGSNDVVLMNVPTIDRSNITSSYAVFIDSDQSGINSLLADATSNLSVRYVLDNLIIRSTVDDELEVRIVNLAGQQVATLPIRLNGGYAELSVNQLPMGVFIANITDSKGHKAVCKFIKR